MADVDFRDDDVFSTVGYRRRCHGDGRIDNCDTRWIDRPGFRLRERTAKNGQFGARAPVDS